MTDKTRIAIFGGGVGALTAAFELIEHDPEEHFSITIYTLGWRLGGKAMVGRDKDVNWRALEHGLHVWAGFYDNAFDLVQRLYARLGLPEEQWRSKFEGLNHFTVMEYVDHSWRPWPLQVRPNTLDPGIDPTALAPALLVRNLLSWVEQAFINSVLADFETPEARLRTQEKIASVTGMPGGFPTPLSAIAMLLDRSTTASGKFSSDVKRLVAAFRTQVTKAHSAAVANFTNVGKSDDDETRRLEILFDLAAGLVQGLLSDEVLVGGLDAIDHREWSEWMMKQNGCKPKSLESGVVRGCYDYVFGYAKGVRQVGAGVGTLGLLRLLLTYKGSIFYTLREPMGEFLIAPLYKYLCEKGVTFKFFHRLDKLVASPDGSAIESVVLGRQVNLLDPNGKYHPLVQNPDNGLESWPSHPLYDKIENGSALVGHDLESFWTTWRDAGCLTLKRRPAPVGTPIDQTFDIAILATGFGGLKKIAHDLTTCHPDTWGKFLAEIQTTPTLALQLWLTKDASQLGWPDPRTVMVGFGRECDRGDRPPLNSWQDNSPLLASETATVANPPRSLNYFVGVFPDTGPSCDPNYPDYQIARAKRLIIDWMNGDLLEIWPKARDRLSGKFDWGLLHVPSSVQVQPEGHRSGDQEYPEAGAAEGPDRLDFQYIRPNINPWERYVLSMPDTLQWRLWPDGSGISNLYLAGDWARTGLDMGCIEAAVMSGRATARAITGANMNIPGYGNYRKIPVPVTLLPVVTLLKQLKTGASGGVGTMEGYLITIWRCSKDVQKLLPPTLSLDPPHGLDATDPENKGKHPLVFLFCRQKNVRPGFVPLGGLRYQEIIELIPFVKRIDADGPSGGPFNYMPHLFLDELAPVLIGVNFYGYNKRLARIASKGGSFQLNCDLGEISTDLSEKGLPGGASTPRFRHLKLVRQMLDHPFISLKTNGVFVYSHLDFCFGGATFQGVEGEVAMGPPFDPRPEDASQTFKVESILDKEYGAFRFQTNWTLSVPLTTGHEESSVIPSDLQEFATKLLSYRRP
ncbi:NAD(P)-binding protein [Bradyrhizobium liaoningense]|uniref:NAD(P)-binding protein n=1 Tax=Bradyrhizobium liaoningense TaxID=43992 RepID=UPI001BACBD04|nr:NAD(P)-binding protein [Bradyrhizobium liaoningense]MBR0906609.1 NAD(P)-binding protein [Bradyrhizobium liaoningense]